MAKKVRMSLLVTEELWQTISIRAVKEHKTKNDVIVELIQKALKE